ncbi:MAG: tetratricopeptide repeat protein [Dermatophilaceae bacterium]
MSQSPFTAAALRGAVDLSALKRQAGPAGPGQAAAGGPNAGDAGSGGLLVTATDSTFQEVVNGSVRVPAIVVLWSGRLAQSAGFVDVMVDVARTGGGRFQVVSVDVDTNPGLLQAFQIQSVPAAVGLVQGQPVPLFVGALSAAEIQPWVDELLKLATQYGVTGRVALDDSGPTAETPAEVEPALSAAHEAALAAIDRGDLPAAAAAYEQALVDDPADEDARLGLAQVHLLSRTEGLDPAVVRAAAAADRGDLTAQLLVADLDVLGGHVEDAFARLVDAVRATTGEDRERVRTHLLELFDIVGAGDERVAKARRALMSALF